MADTSLGSKYRALVRKLLPTGSAWKIAPGSTFQMFIDSSVVELSRVEERADDFLTELDPRLSFEMLDNWESLLKIPDECTPSDIVPTLSARRLRVLQKLTTGGGQSKAFYKLIAQQLGYDSTVIDVINFRDFRTGEGTVGKPLSNSTSPNGTINANGWAYAFQFQAPAAFTQSFAVGQSTVGERLVLSENRTLECVIRKFAPAHATVLFSFGS